MTIDDFIAMTRRVIAKDGFGNYLPTLVLPERRHMAAFEGIPPHVVGGERVPRTEYWPLLIARQKVGSILIVEGEEFYGHQDDPVEPPGNGAGKDAQ